MTREQLDIFDRITAQILDAIVSGAGKFRMPWHVTEADSFLPVNAESRRAYRGVNVLSLWATAAVRDYPSGLWATYKQWQQLGAQVRKGEKAAPVVFWKFPDRAGASAEESDEPDEQSSRGGVLAKGYSVFNVAQVDGFAPPERPALSECARIAAAETFFSSLGTDVRHGGGVACYRSDDDVIHMPPFHSFRDAAGYYSVFGHEATHWTGAKSRLDRDMSARFGSEAYAMEELVAELGAAFLCATLGVSNTPRKEHAAYLASWVGVFKRDKRAVFAAASQAQKALDWMCSKTAAQPQAA